MNIEAKDPKSTGTENTQPGTEAVEPDSTATSSDTLQDVEEKEADTTATDDEQSGGNSSDAPSPDGQFDGSGGSTSGVNDPGPM